MLASDTVVSAEGWSEFDVVSQEDKSQEHLDFAHAIASTFGTTEGKKVLNAMVQKYLISSFSNSNDTNLLLRKQGRADVVKYILSQIEISSKA